MSETDKVESTHLARAACRMLLAALSLATTCTGAMGQVSLATVVDLAQRNSTEVALAQADVNKARAAFRRAKTWSCLHCC